MLSTNIKVKSLYLQQDYIFSLFGPLFNMLKQSFALFPRFLISKNDGGALNAPGQMMTVLKGKTGKASFS